MSKVPLYLRPGNSKQAGTMGCATNPTWNADVRLAGKENSNSPCARPVHQTISMIKRSHGARPVHQIISAMKWIRTTKSSRKNSLSPPRRRGPEVQQLRSHMKTLVIFKLGFISNYHTFSSTSVIKSLCVANFLELVYGL